MDADLTDAAETRIGLLRRRIEDRHPVIVPDGDPVDVSAPGTDDDRTVGWKAMLRRSGATPRQLDYWTRRGWIRGTSPGSGRIRVWTHHEVAVAGLMVRLVKAGFDPQRAAVLARQLSPAADAFPEVVLGPGLVLGIAPMVVDAAVTGGVL